MFASPRQNPYRTAYATVLGVAAPSYSIHTPKGIFFSTPNTTLYFQQHLVQRILQASWGSNTKSVPRRQSPIVHAQASHLLTGLRLVIRFLQPAQFARNGAIMHFHEPCEKPDSFPLMMDEAKQVSVHDGQSYQGSSLMSLPLVVRMKIWEAVFKTANRPVVVHNRLKMEIGDLAILRVCHAIHHEASIALKSVMCRRKIIFKNYTVDRVAMILRSESWASYERFSMGWTKLPCPFPTAFPTLSQNGIFESVSFCLGSEDLDRAVRRRRDFAAFITALSCSKSFKIRDLSIIAKKNWKIDGFDEREIVLSLFKDAFTILGRIKFQGFNEEESALLNQQLYETSILKLE